MSKTILLTKGMVATVDDEDYDYLNQFKWCFSGNYAVHRNYPTGSKPKMIKMHRLINKTPDGFDTDHINRNKLDNRKSNLRTVTRSQNASNMGIKSNNTSGYRGIHWDKSRNKWMVFLWANKEKIYRHRFEHLSAAILARKWIERGNVINNSGEPLQGPSQAPK